MQYTIKKIFIWLIILFSSTVIFARADETSMNVSREIIAAEALANVPGFKTNRCHCRHCPGCGLALT